jgi:hypothetical protein
LISAQRANVLVVFANPNSEAGSNFPNDLAPWIVNVGAIDPLGAPRTGSVSRWYTDFGAPGVDIISTAFNNDFETRSGTSYAAPFATGTASLLLSANSDLRNYDLEQILKRTARRTDTEGTGWDGRVGYGMIDAYEAVRKVSAPYTVVHDAATFIQTHSNVSQTFTASPGNGVASGTYWVDIHRMDANASFSYQSEPWVWLAAGTGLSGSNPNSGQPWKLETVSPTSAQLQTFFYFVRTNSLGQSINRWVPFDPYDTYNHTLGRFEYTVLGKPGTPPPPPLSVALTGPTFLQEGQNGTWTATASGGAAGDHTFRWYVSFDGGITNTLVRQHTTASNTDDYSTTVFQSFTLIVNVERGAETAGHSLFVFVDRADCDPTWEPCVGHLVGEVLPEEFALEPNYPNPFNPQTEIKFALPEPANVTLVVVDLLGREVARLVDGQAHAGFHSVNVDASSWPSGVYLYRIEITGVNSGARHVQTRRMMLIK